MPGASGIDHIVFIAARAAAPAADSGPAARAASGSQDGALKALARSSGPASSSRAGCTTRVRYAVGTVPVDARTTAAERDCDRHAT